MIPKKCCSVSELPLKFWISPITKAIKGGYHLVSFSSNKLTFCVFGTNRTEVSFRQHWVSREMSLNFSEGEYFVKRKVAKSYWRVSVIWISKHWDCYCNVRYRNCALSKITYTAVMWPINTCSDLRKTHFRNISPSRVKGSFLKQFPEGEQLGKMFLIKRASRVILLI